MDNESKFWFLVSTLLTVIIITIILTVGSCSIHRNILVTKMIISGTSPELAQMAVRETEVRQLELIIALKALNDKEKKDNKTLNLTPLDNE